MKISQPIKPTDHFNDRYSSIDAIQLETVNKHIGEQNHV